MQNALKSLENNALAALTSRAPQAIVNAIKTASAKTGVSFTYLMEKAAAESNFNPTIKSKTSSATGLFQFIDSTWMDMMNKFGEKYGINTQGQSRQNLLDLRKDPTVASLMAAEFADGNQSYLEKTVGGNIGNTELYFAHFMGAGGASAFLSKLNKNPSAVGADVFPKEAAANRGVFFDSKTGAPRTLQQIYNFFDNKFSGDTSVDSAVAPNTKAHKPSSHYGSAYDLKPISEERYARVVNTNLRSNSLFEAKRQMDAFFGNADERNAGSSMTDIIGGVPSSFYSNLSNPTSMMLSLLRDDKR